MEDGSGAGGDVCLNCVVQIILNVLSLELYKLTVCGAVLVAAGEVFGLISTRCSEAAVTIFQPFSIYTCKGKVSICLVLCNFQLINVCHLLGYS